MLCFVGIVICDLELAPTASETWREVANRALAPLIIAASFFLLLLWEIAWNPAWQSREKRNRSGINASSR